MSAKAFINRAARVLAGVTMGVIAASAAEAQVYNLDGAYQCLDKTSTDCAQSSEQMPPLPPPVPPPPPIASAITRVVAGTATTADIAEIAKQADAKNPRAIDALAWCTLNGIGVMADPVEAFRLYGEAARLGVPTARGNQITIYNTRLSPEQRQLVLLREQSP